MNKIYTKIILNDLQIRLKKQGGFKTIVQNYKYNSNQCLQQIQTFFYVFKDVLHLNYVIKILEKIFTNIIIYQGNQLQKKIHKKKQYIQEVILFKKSIDLIVDQIANKNFILFTAKDKSFKSILDTIQFSKNLAEFTDFTIKQCIKLKLDDQASYEKLSDIFLILGNIASTDSFLLYHQQMMAKRIIDSLNQPKIQFEYLMLKKISQKMGILAVSSHMSMLKDIQISQQITQRFNNRLAFSSFKWTLKILNPSYWPQNINKDKLTIQFPNSLYSQVKVIQQLYHNQNQYRYLNWKIQKGVSLFQGKFQGKKFRFQSQNSFMMVLMLIAQKKGHKILYGNLKQEVNYQKKNETKNDPLSLLLYVLIENRLILRNNTQNKYSQFFQGQQLEINVKYVPQQSIKPGQVIFIKPSAQLSKQLHQSTVQKQKIIKDRQKLIQAVLVKCLKHSHATKNNSISFSQLYEAIKQHPILGSFNFSQGTVKKRLQQLIARQYCVRDQEDRRIYHYIA